MLTSRQQTYQKKQTRQAEQRLDYLIQQSLLLHKSNSQIAEELGLSRQRIDQLIGASYNPEREAAKKLRADLEFVRYRVYVHKAITLADVARFYGLSDQAVSLIVGGRKTSLDALGVQQCYRCHTVKVPDDFGTVHGQPATTCRACASKNSRQVYLRRKERHGLSTPATQALPAAG